MAIGNSVNDEIREQQRKVLQEKGFVGRLEYFFYYYKWHVIIGTVVAGPFVRCIIKLKKRSGVIQPGPVSRYIQIRIGKAEKRNQHNGGDDPKIRFTQSASRPFFLKLHFPHFTFSLICVFRRSGTDKPA